MENASKALIIAGSILIALIVISLGVYIFSRFSGTEREKANMDEQERGIFNSEITQYIGNSVAGSQVRALATTVRSMNANSLKKNDTRKYVTMYYNDETNYIVRINNNKVETDIKKIETNKFYKVECEFGTDGFINKVKVTAPT